MKKFIALILLLTFVLAFTGCNNKDTFNHSPNDYIVLEVQDGTLLVAEIGEDGKAIEAKQYSVPNYFQKSNLSADDIITIVHNGEILETFPMQFGRIFSMEYNDKETGLNHMVNID